MFLKIFYDVYRFVFSFSNFNFRGPLVYQFYYCYMLTSLNKVLLTYLLTYKVEELIYSADGKVRAVVVKVANNTNRPVYLRRVMQQLIPIEVQACSRQITERELSRPETRVNDNQRPRRIAAVAGEINRRDKSIS